jgi:SAM-dependent methyltransferase
VVSSIGHLNICMDIRIVFFTARCAPTTMIRTYYDLYASSLSDDFMKLLKKFFRNYITESDLHKLARLRLSDNDFLRELKRIRQQTLPGRENSEHTAEDASEYRGSKRAHDVLDILKMDEYDYIVSEATAEKGRYLDIGAHDGSITVEVADEFGFDKENIYALDVDPHPSRSDPVAPGAHVRVEDFDGVNLYYADKFFSLVSFYQVLHHVRDLSLLNDVSRCTKPGGYLIIREHNKPNNDLNGAFAKLVELEHAIYDIIMLDEYENYDEFMKTYFVHCKSKYEWSKILNDHGFKFVRNQDVCTQLPGLTKPGPNGTTVPVFRREPTKHYYALYRKKKKFRASGVFASE